MILYRCLRFRTSDIVLRVLGEIILSVYQFINLILLFSII